MALGITQTARTIPGADTMQSANIALDTSYPAGGYAVDLTQFGLKVLRRVLTVRPLNFASAIYTPILTISYGTYGAISGINLRLLAAGGAEVATGTNVSAASVHIIVEGN